MTIRFEKMHGLGNDFVILDERRSPMQIIEEKQRSDEVRRLACRRTGIGCDQLVVLRPSGRADAFMQIYNADGGEVAACGNATRCVGWLIMREKRTDHALIDSDAGLLECRLAGKERVKVNLGPPRLDWQSIPLARAMDTLRLDGLSLPPQGEGWTAVNMGNPHAVCFVADVRAVPLAEIGPKLEHNPLFPERANITVAQIDSPAQITLRTWERGCGETPACGTAACAAVVAARRRGRVAAEVTANAPGGALCIHWDGDEKDPAHDVWMTGPVAPVFSGELPEGWWV